jgi:hypothetical protein
MELAVLAIAKAVAASRLAHQVSIPSRAAIALRRGERRGGAGLVRIDQTSGERIAAGVKELEARQGEGDDGHNTPCLQRLQIVLYTLGMDGNAGGDDHPAAALRGRAVHPPRLGGPLTLGG